METTSTSLITQRLVAWSDGDPEALEGLMQIVYNELRRLANHYLRSERPDHTLQLTALVHEAYLRLTGQNQVRWQNRAHFFGVAAQMMRRVLVDHARANCRAKRGGRANKLSLDETMNRYQRQDEQIVELDDTHSIATEFIEGQTLRERIRSGMLGLNEIVDIALQIASALSTAHSAGIIHRDIKPENIMVRPDGVVKVLDFGLAQPFEREGVLQGPGHQTSLDSRTDSGTLMVTTSYLSPEQVRSVEIDHRTDIFSLGVVLYEMVSGKRPFTGSSVAATFDAILINEPAPILERELPAQLSRIINRALDKDRDSRYQTADQLHPRRSWI